MRYFLAFIILFTLSSCAVTSKQPCVPNGKATLACPTIVSANQEMATLYIYRPKMLFQGGAWPDMWLDSYEVGPLYNNSHYVLSIIPGEHVVLAKRTSSWENWVVPDFNLKFSVEAGKVYFLRVTPKLDSLFSIGYVTSVSGSGNMALVADENAKVEIKNNKYIGSSTYNR